MMALIDKDALLDAMLPHIVFDGWSDASLRSACLELHGKYDDALIHFPNGGTDALSYHSERADQRMMDALTNDYTFDTMKIRDRIATAVMVRLEQNEAHKDAIRRGIAHFNLPWNMPEGLRLLGNTVDQMWIAAGDESTDYNWYTKRALLSKVYMTTLYFWLEDTSENHEDTREFLHRRINDVMQIGKLQSKLSDPVGMVKQFFSAGPQAR